MGWQAALGAYGRDRQHRLDTECNIEFSIGSITLGCANLSRPHLEAQQVAGARLDLVVVGTVFVATMKSYPNQPEPPLVLSYLFGG